jgi:hypothetical protein
LALPSPPRSYLFVLDGEGCPNGKMKYYLDGEGNPNGQMKYDFDNVLHPSGQAKEKMVRTIIV